MKSILQKEKDALMDTESDPMSYSMIEHQPMQREYRKVSPGEERPGDNNDSEQQPLSV